MDTNSPQQNILINRVILFNLNIKLIKIYLFTCLRYYRLQKFHWLHWNNLCQTILNWAKTRSFSRIFLFVLKQFIAFNRFNKYLGVIEKNVKQYFQNRPSSIGDHKRAWNIFKSVSRSEVPLNGYEYILKVSLLYLE